MPSTKRPNDALHSSATTRDAKAVLSGNSKKNWIARLLPFLGPAFIASIAYVDPGNFATNIQGGAQFGYELLWVILGSTRLARFQKRSIKKKRDSSLTENSGSPVGQTGCLAWRTVEKVYVSTV
jgi:hypothetical protein